jgi:peptide/nickel transport system permease protein
MQRKLYIYTLRRALESLVTLLAVLVLNFALIHAAPGDPALIMAGEYATPEIIEATRVRWGLDKPLYIQLYTYVTGVFRGDLGFSLDFNRPVLDVIVSRLPNTLVLVIPVMIIGLGLGMMLGALAARHLGTKIDTVLQVLALVFYSAPTFWLGLVLLEVFALDLGLFPFLGGGLVGSLQSILWHLTLPVCALIIAWTTPIFMRLTRSSMMEVLKEDYITTSKAIGYPDSVIFYRHALRNALLPSVTMLGLMVGTIFSGVVLVETVFSWPGLGLLLLEAIHARDYPLLMGMFTVVAIAVSISMFVTDMVYALLDPRITYK